MLEEDKKLSFSLQKWQKKLTVETAKEVLISLDLGLLPTQYLKQAKILFHYQNQLVHLGS